MENPIKSVYDDIKQKQMSVTEQHSEQSGKIVPRSSARKSYLPLAGGVLLSAIWMYGAVATDFFLLRESIPALIVIAILTALHIKSPRA